MGRGFAAFAVAMLVGAACSASPDASASPSPSAPPTPAAPSAAPTIAAPTVAVSTPPQSPTASPTPRPSLYPAAALPVHGTLAKRGAFLSLAPAPDGTLYVLIPHKSSTVLTRLDRAGAPAPGWPVTLPHTTYCEFLAAAADGSVRAICDATDIAQPDVCCGTVRAFALDPDGRPLRGWPVEIDATTTARVAGNDLVVLSDLPVTETPEIGSVRSKVHLSRIGPDGRVARGVEVPMVYRGGSELWAIGPDGVAYGTSFVIEDVGQPDQALAIETGGPVDGWPVTLPASGSPLAFDADGRILLLVGARTGGPWAAGNPAPRILAINPDDPGGTPASGAIALELWYDVDCTDSPLDRPPLSRGGVSVVREGMSFHALDADRHLMPGWPYEAPSYLQEWAYPTTGSDDGLDCSTCADPVLGPDGTLFVSLDADSASTGGSLVAVGRSGKVVPGWPVALRRSGSGFWSVEVGPDGTVFAAAVERETHGLSATILGIAPDSTTLWRTTVLEP